MSDTHPTILVIDDSQTTLNLVSGYLSRLNVEVITGTNGYEGLALVRKHRPALVLCDIVMPLRDGYEFLSELRSDAEIADTPVVLMSGVSVMQNRLRALDSGADDLLTKPFDRVELISRVKALLRLKERQDEVRQAKVDLRQRIRLLSTLFVVSTQLKDSLDPADIYRVINETLRAITEAEIFTIYIRDGDTCVFRLIVEHGTETAQFPVCLDASDFPDPFREVIGSGQPYYRSEAFPLEIEVFGQPLLASVPVKVVMPIVMQQTTIGLINVHKFSPNRGDRLDFELLNLISGQAAGAIHALNLAGQVKQYATQLERADQQLQAANRSLEEQMFHLHTLMLFSAQLHSSVDLQKIYARVRDLAVNFIGIEAFIILYRDQWGEEYTYAGVADGAEIEPRDLTLSCYSVLIQRVEEVRTAFFSEDSDPAYANIHDHCDPLPVACLPLMIDSKPQGVFLIERMMAQKTHFTQQDYELLALLTREAATAIHNGHLHRRIELISVTDGLTGAFNRRYFDEQIIAEFGRNLRYEHNLSLLMIDLDNFKAVNEQYGHQAGDEILREVVRRLSKNLRDVDTVARYGGDEFALILPETNPKSAQLVATRILEAIKQSPFRYNETDIFVSISLGIATTPPIKSPTDLIEVADQTMFHSKHRGKERQKVEG